jgi:hypothetical protein
MRNHIPPRDRDQAASPLPPDWRAKALGEFYRLECAYAARDKQGTLRAQRALRALGWSVVPVAPRAGEDGR